ncbi:hypothetical protein HAX54_044970, partial [Datura stramonium]|nr:hypothetical protein [Datura stramonium]
VMGVKPQNPYLHHLTTLEIFAAAGFTIEVRTPPQWTHSKSFFPLWRASDHHYMLIAMFPNRRNVLMNQERTFHRTHSIPQSQVQLSSPKTSPRASRQKIERSWTYST